MLCTYIRPPPFLSTPHSLLWEIFCLSQHLLKENFRIPSPLLVVVVVIRECFLLCTPCLLSPALPLHLSRDSSSCAPNPTSPLVVPHAYRIRCGIRDAGAVASHSTGNAWRELDPDTDPSAGATTIEPVYAPPSLLPPLPLGSRTFLVALAVPICVLCTC